MANSLVLDGCRFTVPKRIAPEKTKSGHVRAYMPQSRYAKADIKRVGCEFLIDAPYWC